MKVQVSVDDRLMERIDGFIDENYMTRSQFFSISANQYLCQLEAVKALSDISIAICKIADEGKISEEARRELESYERLCKAIVSSK